MNRFPPIQPAPDDAGPPPGSRVPGAPPALDGVTSSDGTAACGPQPAPTTPDASRDVRVQWYEKMRRAAEAAPATYVVSAAMLVAALALRLRIRRDRGGPDPEEKR